MFEGIKNNSVSALAFIITTLMGLTIAVIYLINIILWSNYPDFGYGFRTATGINVIGFVTENGRNSGLEVGDQLVETNGESFSNMKKLRALTRRELGDENTYFIERKGRRFAITIKNIPIGFKNSFYKSGFHFLLGLGYVMIGIVVFLMKPHARSSWAFFIFTTVFGLFIVFLYKIGLMTPSWMETIQIFIYAFTPAVFIHLTLSFPQERNIFKRRQWFQLLPYIISLILFIYASKVTISILAAPRAVILAFMSYLALSVLLLLASCIQLRLTSTSEIVKLRSKMILLGFAIAASLPLLDFVSSVLFSVYLIPNFNFYLPFFITIPAFIGYSIVKHDLFDIDTVIKRTYGYVITTSTIAGTYGLLVLMSNYAFGDTEFAKSPLFQIIFVLTIVLLFNPVRFRVQKFIDRVFYRLEYDYRDTLQKISESMRTLLGLDAVGKSIMNFAMETMFIDTGCVVLLRRDKSEYECLIPAGKQDEGLMKSNNQRNVEGISQEPSETSFQSVTNGNASDLQGLTFASDESLIQKISEQKKEVTIYDIQEDPIFDGIRESCRRVFDELQATLLVPLIYEDRLNGLIALGRKKSGKFYRREDIKLLNTLANQGAVAIENAYKLEEIIEKERLKTKIMDAFGKYVTHEIRDQILEGQIPLDGETKDVTVLFADLRDFTTLAESSPAKEVVKIINGYFSEMSAAIRRNHGLVLQFIGDEIEAVFGAPLPLDNHPTHAVQAALEMQARMTHVNEKLQQQGYRPLRHGIGLHTGKVVAANIGSDDRLSYALVGDTVNIASRVQGLNKKFHTEILLTATTRARLLNGNVPVEKLPATTVKGKREPVEIYKIV